jgi:hypothetical protein
MGLASGAPEPVVDVIGEFPPCGNVVEATALRDRFVRLLGTENVKEAAPGMASEDFGSLPLRSVFPPCSGSSGAS